MIARIEIEFPSLVQLVKKFEGLSLKPYLCPAGIPTIGYGHTGSDISLKMKPISKAKADELLYHDLKYFIEITGILSPILIFDEPRHSAIADFIYNLGITRYKASTLKKRVDSGDWYSASEEIKKWVFAGGKKLKGLIKRRQAEADLLWPFNYY